jgi:plasmid stabilization system protein ParE
VAKSKAYTVRIQRQAIDELDQIYRIISEDYPSRAKSFLKGLKTKILGLKKFPLRGSRAKILESKGIKTEIRFIEHKKYLIFYVVEKEVTVLHVSAPGRDWMRFFY